VTDGHEWQPGDPAHEVEQDGDRCSNPECECTWSPAGPKRCPVCDAPAASEPPETPREAAVRSAWAYLAESVRDKRNSLVLDTRLRVCEAAVAYGPQVITYYKAGRCYRCGERSPEDGYFTCEPCNTRPRCETEGVTHDGRTRVADG
jgi:hypothetical protein